MKVLIFILSLAFLIPHYLVAHEKYHSQVSFIDQTQKKYIFSSDYLASVDEHLPANLAQTEQAEASIPAQPPTTRPAPTMPTPTTPATFTNEGQTAPPAHSLVKKTNPTTKTLNNTPSTKSTKKHKTSARRSSTKKNTQWILFEWLNENHISTQWAYGFLDEEDKKLYAPPLLQKKITQSFKHESLLYLNFRHDLIRFPYILTWGLRGSLGLARNYDLQSDYFFPLSLSGVLSLRIWKHQPVIPFVGWGFSSWNLNMSDDFSKIFPLWTVGAEISLSLFKRSLRYIFANDYGVQDIGFIMEWKNHLSPLEQNKSGPFLKTFHFGIYCRF